MSMAGRDASAPAGEQRCTLTVGRHSVNPDSPPAGAGAPPYRPLRDRQRPTYNLRLGSANRGPDFVRSFRSRGSSPRTAGPSEEALTELTRGQLGGRVGDPLSVETHRALRDLPGAFLVRLHQAGQRQQAGQADAPVLQMLGEELELGDVVGHLVLLEDLVEGGLGLRPGAVAVVEVDDRPGEEPLGGVGVELPRGAAGRSQPRPGRGASRSPGACTGAGARRECS